MISEDINPLTEADPASLDELWLRFDQHLALHEARTPQAKRTLELMVAEYRRLREVWAEAEARGARRAPSARKKSSDEATLAALGLGNAIATPSDTEPSA